MIAPNEVAELITQQFPDADVQITDKTGMSDHFIINVVTKSFDGVGIMDRHRMVMSALMPAMQTGRLHAAEIKTDVPK